MARQNTGFSNLRYKKNYQHRFKGHSNILLNRTYKPLFSRLALVACENCRITYQQLEAVRRTLTRPLKRLKVKIKINQIPNKFNIARKANIRMGRGKAKTGFWVKKLKPGTVILYFQISQKFSKNNFFILDTKLFTRSLKATFSKLPVRARLVNI